MKTLWIVFSRVLVLIPLANTLSNTLSLDLTQLDENESCNQKLDAVNDCFGESLRFIFKSDYVWLKNSGQQSRISLR